MSLPVNISGSRAAAVLGLSKYQTQVEVWAQICEARRPGFLKERGYVLPVFEGDASTRWGTAFESAIISLAEKKIGKNIVSREAFNYDPKNNFVACHIDGLYSEWFGENGYSIIHEGKTTNALAFDALWGDPETNKIPQEYQIQAQHNMICTGAEKCIVSVLVFPKSADEFEKLGWIFNPFNQQLMINNISTDQSLISDWAFVLDQMGYFYQYTITANPKLQKMMVKKYKKFWNDHVLTEIEPPVMDADDIKILCPEPVGTIILTNTAERLVKEYADINREIGSGGMLAKRKDQIRKDLLTYFYDYGRVNKLPVDDDSTDRWIFRNESGDKLGSFDGKTFRVNGGKNE